LEKILKIKFKFEEVKERIEARGFKLLSTEYINNASKLEIECSLGHRWKATYASLLNKKTGCPYCAHKAPLTYEDVKDKVEARGFKLISTEYIDCSKKIKVMCSFGHEWEVACTSIIHSNSGCPYCAHQFTLSYEEAKARIEARGFELVSTEYIDSMSKLKLRCKLGHEWEANYNNIVNNKRGCPYCSGKAKYTLEEIRDRVSQLGFELLSTKYVNIKSKLKVRCSVGHEWEVAGNNLLNSKTGCPYCAGSISHTYKEVKAIVESIGYELLSTEYKNVDTRLRVRCKFGHEWEAIYDNLVNKGSGCPYCNFELHKGIGNPSWNGGVTSLMLRLRKIVDTKYTNNIRWARDKKERDNYTCQISGKVGGKLNVHHLYNFAGMVHKVLDDLGLSDRSSKQISEFSVEELNLIAEKVIKENSKIEGITILYELHNLFHKPIKVGGYGKKENTPEQMEEFKKRYDAGEFEEYLKNV
jgi:hypothetical protein